MSEVIKGNIIDNNPVVTGNIQENETIFGNIIEAIQLPSTTMAYTIDFDENQTISAFYSKHVGNITVISSTNVSSYTIDGASDSLPFAISLNTTYLFEITKTTPGAVAQLVITVEPSAYTETINEIDWTTGDGRYTYLLGDTTANTTLLKYDNDLLIRSNWNGISESFTTDPLDATITLPTLPASGYWSRLLYVKDHYMLISGGNTTSKDKYFCKVAIDTDIVTDLSGNINQYSQFTGGDQNMYMTTQFYDYVNNIAYWGTRLNTTTIKLDDVVNLNLNTFVFDDSVQFKRSARWGQSRKNHFDPYQKSHLIQGLAQRVDNDAGYQYEWAYSNTRMHFNPFNNRYYWVDENESRIYCEFDHKANFISKETSVGSVRMSYFISVDKPNNHIVQPCRLSIATYKHNFRKYGVQSYSWAPIYDKAGETDCFDAMHGKDQLHLALYTGSQRLHMFDMNVDVSVQSAEFGYLDLPISVWSIYTSRLL